MENSVSDIRKIQKGTGERTFFISKIHFFVPDKLFYIWEEEEAAEGQIPGEAQCCL